MAKNMQPILKRCKTLGIEPAVMGVAKKSIRNQAPSRKKQSEYGMQLNEKQKVKFIYGVLEKQFAKYYEKANKEEGITGENLLRFLERRLDNVVFRAGFANTRRQARQLVNHSHFLVNGKKVNIPSYLVNKGDVITIREKSITSEGFKKILGETEGRALPKWLDKDANQQVTVVNFSDRDDIDFEVNETLIVELYSK